MKRLWLWFVLLALSVSAFGLVGGGAKDGGGATVGGSGGSTAPSIVQTCPFNTTGAAAFSNSVSCTFNSTLTTGKLAAWAYYQGTGGANLAVSGCGATWTLQGVASTGANWFIGSGGSGACTVTFTASGGTNSTFIMNGWEYNNATVNGDGNNIQQDGSGCTTCTGPSVTTTQANDLVLAGVVTPNANTIIVNSPFTDNFNTANVGGQGWATDLGFYVQPSSGAISPVWSRTGSGTLTEGTLAIKSF